MSGASPKHTKSGRHKACLGSCANSCHREGTENLGGWAQLGQTGCPETYSRDYCRSQSLSLADVQTTPSTGGRGAQRAADTPEDRREELACRRPAGMSCRLQGGATAACSAFAKHLLSTFYMSSTRRIRQPTARRPPRKLPGTTLEARGMVGKPFSQDPSGVGFIPSLLQVTKQRSAITCHLAQVTPPVGVNIQSQPSRG